MALKPGYKVDVPELSGGGWRIWSLAPDAGTYWLVDDRQRSALVRIKDDRNGKRHIEVLSGPRGAESWRSPSAKPTT